MEIQCDLCNIAHTPTQIVLITLAGKFVKQDYYLFRTSKGLCAIREGLISDEFRRAIYTVFEMRSTLHAYAAHGDDRESCDVCGLPIANEVHYQVDQSNGGAK